MGKGSPMCGMHMHQNYQGECMSFQERVQHCWKSSQCLSKGWGTRKYLGESTSYWLISIVNSGLRGNLFLPASGDLILCNQVPQWLSLAQGLTIYTHVGFGSIQGFRPPLWVLEHNPCFQGATTVYLFEVGRGLYFLWGVSTSKSAGPYDNYIFNF